MNAKQFLIFVLAGILSLALSACGAAAQATPTPPPPTVRLPNTATPMPPTATAIPPTVTPTTTPTAAPTPTQVPRTFAFNRSKQTVALGELASLRAGWVATTKELTQEFIDTVNISMKIDGQSVPGDLKKYWGPIVEYHQKDPQGNAVDGYVAPWIYPLVDNPAFQTPGVHRAELTRQFTRELTDGWDQFHQGEKIIGWVDIEVVP